MNYPKRLVIDDVRVTNFPARISRSVEEALKLIRTESWDEVWLDHDMDLAQDKRNVVWMTARLHEDAYPFGQIHDVGMFVLHSANFGGRRRMREHLKDHYKVIDLEEYPDRTLALTGGGVVDMYVEDPHPEWKVRRGLGYAIDPLP